MAPETRPPRYPAAVDVLARETARFGRSELKRALTKLLATAPWANVKKAQDEASKVAESMKSSLAITPEAAKHYEADRNQISNPYLEGS
jgi:hypothetical protein